MDGDAAVFARLDDLQRYVEQLEIDRGFSHQNVTQKCLLLGEEVGELFKAVRKQERLGIDAEAKVGSVGEELADILIYVCSIANRLQIDLAEALAAKEEVNKKRVWI
jgi:NTP pyrophosphatase (non-canonical NTP hydrolase)